MLRPLLQDGLFLSGATGSADTLDHSLGPSVQNKLIKYKSAVHRPHRALKGPQKVKNFVLENLGFKHDPPAIKQPRNEAPPNPGYHTVPRVQPVPATGDSAELSG